MSFSINQQLFYVEAHIGESLLQIAKRNDLPIDGACGGNLACSTCHIVMPEEFYIPPSYDEENLLDFVNNLRPTSRLGCQVFFLESMHNMTVTIP